MRLAPVPMAWFRDVDRAERWAAESSITTHAAPECVDACRLLARMTCRALLGQSKEHVLFGDAGSFRGTSAVTEIARRRWRDKRESEIRGSDTTAAVCGQLAGAFHGEGGIPQDWLQRLALRADEG